MCTSSVHRAHLIDHTKKTAPTMAGLVPRCAPITELGSDGNVMGVNTHLHFDHCGGNHLFAGRSIYVQRRGSERSTDLGQLHLRECVPRRWAVHP